MKDSSTLPAQTETVEYYYDNEAMRRLMQDAHKAQAAEMARLAGLAAAALGRLARRIGSFLGAVSDSFSRAAYYRDLSGLSDWELANRGISRGEIKYFVDRCFRKPAIAVNDGHAETKRGGTDGNSRTDLAA